MVSKLWDVGTTHFISNASVKQNLSVAGTLTNNNVLALTAASGYGRAAAAAKFAQLANPLFTRTISPVLKRGVKRG